MHRPRSDQFFARKTAQAAVEAFAAPLADPPAAVASHSPHPANRRRSTSQERRTAANGKKKLRVQRQSDRNQEQRVQAEQAALARKRSKQRSRIILYLSCFLMWLFCAYAIALVE
jgi:hypothetical protein